jgi:hypothetical protein
MTMESRLSSYTVVIALLLGLAPLSAGLADQPDDAEAERCILINRIRNTYVLDDQRILFYMRGKEVYLNQLPRRCAGLGLERRFMYRTSLSQLCDLDTISVLRSFGGGFMQGATCGLGKFQPITEEDADALRNAEPPKPEAEELPTAKPEEVGKPE